MKPMTPQSRRMTVRVPQQSASSLDGAAEAAAEQKSTSTTDARAELILGAARRGIDTLRNEQEQWWGNPEPDTGHQSRLPDIRQISVEVPLYLIEDIHAHGEVPARFIGQCVSALHSSSS